MIRVVAYNVSGGLDPRAVGEVLTAVEPQIVCVLEAPRGARLRRIARVADLDVVGRAGRRGAATALLVDPDAVSVRTTSTLPLTTPRNAPTRTAAHAIVSAGGLRLSVLAVQLGLRPEVRRQNLDEVLAFLDRVDAPSVIGCDLNESVRSPVASTLATTFQDAHAVAGAGQGPTYPTPDPSTRQDFVFVDRSLTVLGCHVAASPPADVASHHRPVVVDLAGRDEQPLDRHDAARRAGLRDEEDAPAA